MIVKDLLAALKGVACAVYTAPTTVPVLACVKLTPSYVAACDMCCWAEVPLSPIDGLDQPVLVSHADLVRYLSKSPNDAVVSVKRDNGSVTVTVDGVSVKWDVLAVADYPDRPTIGDHRTTVNVEDPADLDGVLVAMSRDETRPVMTAVNLAPRRLRGRKWRWVMAACDSYRLHALDIGPGPAPGHPSKRFEDINIPGVYLRKLPKKGVTKFEVGTTHARVSRGDVTLTIKLIDGQYPKVEELFPSETVGSIDLNDGALEKLRRVATMAKNRGPVRFAANGDGHVSALILDDLQSATLTVVDVGSHAGEVEGKEFGFNPGFMVDAIEYAGPVMELVSQLRPAQFHRGARAALIMPIRL